MARPLTLLLLIAAAVGGAFWWQHRRADRAEWEAGLAASRTLSAVFAKTSILQVAQLKGEAVTRVEGKSGFGMFGNVQTTRAPYAVDYLIDLHRLSARDYRWNAQTRVMVVTIPEVTVGQPRIDLAQARSEQAGVFISRQSGLAMGQHVARNLATVVTVKANAPDQLGRAQDAARDAVTALVAAPLAAAGLGDVTVRVRLAGEDRPAGPDRARWDTSRPVGEVVRR